MSRVVGGRIGLEKSFVSVRALEDINFSLQSGDRLGIIGSNGSGKTTLLRVLAGLYHPTSGRLRVKGTVDSLLAIGAGMDLENNAAENIRLRLTLMGLSKSQIRERTPGIVDFADLGSFAELPLRTYSSGMLVRLGFSIATSVGAEILLMDEWLSAGDAEFSRKSQERISEVVNNSEILVIASHNRGTIERSCNKVLWLESGKVKMFDQTAKVLPLYFGGSNAK